MEIKAGLDALVLQNQVQVQTRAVVLLGLRWVRGARVVGRAGESEEDAREGEEDGRIMSMPTVGC